MRRGLAPVAETGKSVMETPALWLRPLGAVAGLVVEVSGWEYIEDGSRQGRGLILLTPHLGCWEVAGQYISHRIPLTVM